MDFFVHNASGAELLSRDPIADSHETPVRMPFLIPVTVRFPAQYGPQSMPTPAKAAFVEALI